MKHCRFRTSWGGSAYCQHPPYLEGFCKFHYLALQSVELNENGVLDERLSDQASRREINYYGIDMSDVVYLEYVE